MYSRGQVYLCKKALSSLTLFYFILRTRSCSVPFQYRDCVCVCVAKLGRKFNFLFFCLPVCAPAGGLHAHLKQEYPPEPNSLLVTFLPAREIQQGRVADPENVSTSSYEGESQDDSYSSFCYFLYSL